LIRTALPWTPDRFKPALSALCARAQVKPSPWSTLLAQVVEQEQTYWAAAAQLDEDAVDEMSEEEAWAADEKSYPVI
jgi:hypothetical protein